eukprot:Tbor_TRINITY_DN6005_c0_g1::TRINITY_DN6005_c0_g1_i4::g.10836::m.10836
MAGITGVWMYLSPITLAVMEDSGHYTVDWSKAEDPKWMYKAGCGVIDDKCDTDGGGKGKYFCFDRTFVGCAPDYRSFGQCASMNDPGVPDWAKYIGDQGRITGKEPLMDYCPIVRQKPETQCDNPLITTAGTAERPQYHGLDGRCFKSHVRKAVYGKDPLPKVVIPVSCLQARCTNNVVEFQFHNFKEWISCPKGTRVDLTTVPILKANGYI